MHVAVFGSGSGTILRAMLAAQKQDSSSPFAIRLLYTDRECRVQSIAEEEPLPLIYNPWNREIPRREYDSRGLERLLAFSQENKCPIDFLLLAGYMRLMSSVWLSAFPFRILNIHPADLTQLDSQGKRRLVGANAVFKALEEGQPRTRTSAILVDETVDGGPVLVSGPWVPYAGDYPITPEKAASHQEMQKAKSDWPSCLAALRLIAEGRAGRDQSQLFLDGRPLPAWGMEVTEKV